MTAGAAPVRTEKAGPTERIWNIPDRSVGLAGHRQLLAAVHRTLRAGERALLCTDARRAGTGATTAAVEFAHRHARDYDVAWWIPAADPELVPIELAELAEALGLARVTDDAEAATSRLLDALRHRDRYLLVFDDAENPRQLARFLPPGAGDVVIVSADPAWRTHATAHPVDPFTRAESVALLRARRPDLPVDVAARFAAALADLPLAVDTAATLLAASGTDVEQLLRRLDRIGHDGRPDPAAAVWDVAFDHLAAEDPAALALLALVAWLGPGPVPLHLVTDHPHALPPVLADVARDPAAFNRLTADLRRRGSARVGVESMALHRVPAALLVARTAAEHCGGAADGWAGVAIRLLRAAVPADLDTTAGWATWRRMLPLVLAATDPARHLGQAAADAGWLLRDAARYLNARGQCRAAVRLSRDADDLFAVRPSSEGPAARVRPAKPTPFPRRRDT